MTQRLPGSSFPGSKMSTLPADALCPRCHEGLPNRASVPLNDALGCDAQDAQGAQYLWAGIAGASTGEMGQVL